MKQHGVALVKGCLLVLFLTCGLGTSTLRAQLIGSVSGGISGGLSDENQTEGFDSAFDPESSSLTNPTQHTDVSDPTHAQLLGSAISPTDNAYISASVSNFPQTGVLTDAQAAVGVGGAFSFGGKRSQIFTAGSNSTASARGSSLASFGLASMESAFSGGTSGRAAFSGTASNTAGTSLSFSGEGIPVPPTVSGVGATQTIVSTGIRDPNSSRDIAVGGYYATDPVLSGSSAGYEGDLQMPGDEPGPSTQTGLFFAESATAPPPVYEFDDGQTPLPSAGLLAGGRIEGAPDYGPPSNGFPDSTRGLAGLPSELSNASSPLSTPLSLAASPFPPVSEGNVYGLTLRFSPSLHALPTSKPAFNFEAVERREEEQRLLHGVSISQASEIYKQDLRKYRRQAGRPLPPKPTRDLGATGASQDLLGAPSIR